MSFVNARIGRWFHDCGDYAARLHYHDETIDECVTNAKEAIELYTESIEVDDLLIKP